MFQYFLAFLLLNSCYQSLGTPPTKKHLIAFSLTELANQCENKFLSQMINTKLTPCSIFAPPYDQNQLLCLIFYDINKQLCEAVATSKLALTEDFSKTIAAEQDINKVCILAKDWVFTNITEDGIYKNESEYYFKNPTTCGVICGSEKTMAANFYCKYYKWGLEKLKSQVVTASDSVKNSPIVIPQPVIPEPVSNVHSNKELASIKPDIVEVGDIKTQDVQIKKTESTILKPTLDKSNESSDVAVQKSVAQTTSIKQTTGQENRPTVDNVGEVDRNALEHPSLPAANTNELANKSTVPIEPKQPGGESDPVPLPETGKEAPSLDSKGVDPVDAKVPGDDDYADSEVNDGGDDDGDDPGLEIKSEKKPEEPSAKNKLITSQDSDVSQKEFYPNPISDSFTDDGDHFFPFFLTAVILVVLLYVLYHNKSKVGKVFFGLILEGRQGGRRRNSRGHAYRRLDTLEQAMSANTAAPPSKIIY